MPKARSQSRQHDADFDDIKNARNSDRAQAETQIPEWLTPKEISQYPDTPPPLIIEGVLYLGAKFGIAAGSKSMKTWLLLYICYCISNGLEFLGFKCRKSKVIYFDFELMDWEIRSRLEKIKKAVGKGDFADIRCVDLRQYADQFVNHLSSVEQIIRQDGFQVACLDPMYKMLLDKDENSNGVVANILHYFTKLCAACTICCIYAHHHSKGGQGNKEAIDRQSGAGAWGRDPDALLDLTNHEEDDCFTATLYTRSCEPNPDFVVRKVFPLLVRSESTQTTRQSRTPKPKSTTHFRHHGRSERVRTGKRTRSHDQATRQSDQNLQAHHQ